MHPLLIAQIVARNIVPVAGILLFGWSAANVLVLYFIDTLLSMGVIATGVARFMLPPATDEGLAARINAEAGYIGAGLMIIAVVAVPLGVPLIFMLAPGGADWREMLADRGLHIGIALQVAAACWSGFGLYRALRTQTPDQLRLKRRFALVFLRWIVVLMVTYTGFFVFLGHYSALFYVVLFVATSIFIEIAPDRFLRAMPGGAEDADPEVPGVPTSAAPPHRRHPRKHR
jgi:hypothetical protein